MPLKLGSAELRSSKAGAGKAPRSFNHKDGPASQYIISCPDNGNLKQTCGFSAAVGTVLGHGSCAHVFCHQVTEPSLPESTTAPQPRQQQQPQQPPQQGEHQEPNPTGTDEPPVYSPNRAVTGFIVTARNGQGLSKGDQERLLSLIQQMLAHSQNGNSREVGATP